MTWRDRSGRTLADYPRPSLAVDVALLSVLDAPGGDDGRGGGDSRGDGGGGGGGPRLAVLALPGDGGSWRLPGTFVHERETLQAAALRALRTKAGVTGERPEQLRVFDDPDRDPRGWVVSVAHVDLVPPGRLPAGCSDGGPAAAVRLLPVGGEPVRALAGGVPTRLDFDHDLIVERAVAWARAAYAGRPDPSRLLGEDFTLAELRRVHEAVRGRTLQKDVFRRAMEGRVAPTGRLRRGTVGKPAGLYRRV